MRRAWTAGKIVRGVPSILEQPEPHIFASAIDKIPLHGNLSWSNINSPSKAVNQQWLSPVRKDDDGAAKMVPISPETSETVNDRNGRSDDTGCDF